jgi:hypothetical protein
VKKLPRSEGHSAPRGHEQDGKVSDRSNLKRPEK